jgi:hypothetical protein
MKKLINSPENVVLEALQGMGNHLTWSSPLQPELHLGGRACAREGRPGFRWRPGHEPMRRFRRAGDAGRLPRRDLRPTPDQMLEAAEVGWGCSSSSKLHRESELRYGGAGGNGGHQVEASWWTMTRWRTAVYQRRLVGNRLIEAVRARPGGLVLGGGRAGARPAAGGRAWVWLPPAVPHAGKPTFDLPEDRWRSASASTASRAASTFRSPRPTRSSLD